nr:hypothetical protein [Clostridia bacterium]
MRKTQKTFYLYGNAKRTIGRKWWIYGLKADGYKTFSGMGGPGRMLANAGKSRACCMRERVGVVNFWADWAEIVFFRLQSSGGFDIMMSLEMRNAYSSLFSVCEGEVQCLW